ncbi:hypothetical protein J6590_093291 [Homalodisca vitripennis]|nr:hypothetical protein J6590_048870 [Homalodisca vitripennis]KAG8334315.1 hypothetical protein J6590_093291 [Homalodisca vitripennis]
MSRRSILISHMGSSLRSEPELEYRGSASTHSYDLLTPLSPRDRSFDTVSEASGEHSVVSHPFSEEAPRALCHAYVRDHNHHVNAGHGRFAFVDQPPMTVNTMTPNIVVVIPDLRVTAP